MSRQGKRQSATRHPENITRFPSKRHLRVVKDELANEDQPFIGGEMKLAYAECTDDRRPRLDGAGVRLRRAREARGLTLDDVSRSTKISRTVLAALETGDVIHLPAGIYTRGFVKAYASEVGLDPERTSREYLAEIGATTAEHAGKDHATPAMRTVAHHSIAATGRNRPALANDQARQVGWLTTAAAAVGLIVYLVAFNSRDDRAETPAVTTSGAVTSDAVRATGATDQSTAQDAALAAQQPLRVELVTNGPCWLAVSIDGEPAFARLLQAGERHTLDIEEEAVLRVGDPAALSVSINGRPARPLGAPGQPVDVRINRTNFREF